MQGLISSWHSFRIIRIAAVLFVVLYEHQTVPQVISELCLIKLHNAKVLPTERLHTRTHTALVLMIRARGQGRVGGGGGWGLKITLSV